jgi:endogenous inhibitor of DNA gyrase (YacG/DUF329 family)
VSTGGPANVTPLRPKRACPECGRPSERSTYPFCSPRCKAIDLNRWLSGSYAIPVVETDESSDDETQR